jgi:hypothetical protein
LHRTAAVAFLGRIDLQDLMHVWKQAAAAQCGGMKGVPGARFCAANAASCRVHAILKVASPLEASPSPEAELS